MPEHHRWSVDVFHVRDHEHQQIILDTLLRAERDLTALGTMTGHYEFVIVETCSVADRVFVWQTVRACDASARKSYSFRPPEPTRRSRPFMAPVG